MSLSTQENLGLSMMIQSGTLWLQLEDPAGGYELHAETFATRQVSHRKKDVSSEWVEGEYTQRSLRENVVEAVSVWVSGETVGETMTRMRALTSCLDQPNFGIRWEIDGYSETWQCQSSDYSIESDQPMLFSRLCLVKAQVPRLPGVVL